MAKHHPARVGPGRQIRANSGHSPMAWRTGQIDPKLKFLIHPTTALHPTIPTDADLPDRRLPPADMADDVERRRGVVVLRQMFKHLARHQ